MPAKKKPVGQHKASGTYQPFRHQERAEKSTATGDRVVPDWLPARAKPVYAELMQELPPLCSNDAITLSQVAVLKSELMETPDDFTPQKHTQLRHLCATVKAWIDDYQSMKPANKEDNPWLKIMNTPRQPPLPKDEYEEWQQKRERTKAEHEAMTPEERAERSRQTLQAVRTKES